MNESMKVISAWKVIPLYFCKHCGSPARVDPEEHDVWGCGKCGVATDDLMGTFDRISPWEVYRWRSFESAPKDGSLIIAWREDAGVFTARWIPGEDGDEIKEIACWFDGDMQDLTGMLPTFWQPLPEGPK